MWRGTYLTHEIDALAAYCADLDGVLLAAGEVGGGKARACTCAERCPGTAARRYKLGRQYLLLGL